jgi:hypothetical protein
MGRWNLKVAATAIFPGRRVVVLLSRASVAVRVEGRTVAVLPSRVSVAVRVEGQFQTGFYCLTVEGQLL